MASAGRILIMPKGAYSASATYEMLDMVSHNGTTWLAKKTVKGIEPSAPNSEHWHNMLDFDPSDFESRKADGGTLAVVINPNGNDYVDYSFELEQQKYINVYANTSNTSDIFVLGVAITDYVDNKVFIRIKLNRPVTEDVHFGIGYLYL